MRVFLQVPSGPVSAMSWVILPGPRLSPRITADNASSDLCFHLTLVRPSDRTLPIEKQPDLSRCPPVHSSEARGHFGTERQLQCRTALLSHISRRMCGLFDEPRTAMPLSEEESR